MEYNDMNVSRLNFYLFTSDKYVRNYTKQGKDCHAIGFLLSGEGKLHVNEQNIALKPGDAFFIAKGFRKTAALILFTHCISTLRSRRTVWRLTTA